MNCPQCGKLVSDESVFCIECGSALQQPQPHTDLAGVPNSEAEHGSDKIAIKELRARLESFVEKWGAVRLSRYLSMSLIAVVVMLRLLGPWLSSLLIAAMNGFLIYTKYKSTAKIDREMCAWSIGAILVWLIMLI